MSLERLEHVAGPVAWGFSGVLVYRLAALSLLLGDDGGSGTMLHCFRLVVREEAMSDIGN